MPHGRAPRPGERFASAAMARTLEAIARDRTARRSTAASSREAMVAPRAAHGGGHTLEDFAAHTADWVTPIAQDYRGYTVHEIPPNGQGIAALMALGMLGNFDLRVARRPIRWRAQHLQIEAMKLAFADAYRYVGDARTMTVTPNALLDRGYLASRARCIDPARAQDFGPGEPPRSGTVYLCAADAERHDGVADPVELHGLRLGRGRARTRASACRTAAPASRSTPATRTRSARASARITRSFRASSRATARRYAAFGVMGGPIQPPGHVQTLVRMIDYGMNPQAALDAPRWKVNAEQLDRPRGDRQHRHCAKG